MILTRPATLALCPIFAVGGLFAEPNLTFLYRKVDGPGRSRLILIPSDPAAKITGQPWLDGIPSRPPLAAIVLPLPNGPDEELRFTRFGQPGDPGGVRICPSDTYTCADVQDGTGAPIKGQHVEVLLTEEVETELANYLLHALDQGMRFEPFAEIKNIWINGEPSTETFIFPAEVALRFDETASIIEDGILVFRALWMVDELIPAIQDPKLT